VDEWHNSGDEVMITKVMMPVPGQTEPQRYRGGSGTCELYPFGVVSATLEGDYPAVKKSTLRSLFDIRHLNIDFWWRLFSTQHSFATTAKR